MKPYALFPLVTVVALAALPIQAQQNAPHQHQQFDRMDRKIEDARKAGGDRRHELMREHMQMMRDHMQAMHGMMGGAGSGQTGQDRMGPGRMGQGGMGGSGPETMQNMQTRMDMMQRMMEQMQKQQEMMLDNDRN